MLTLGYHNGNQVLIWRHADEELMFENGHWYIGRWDYQTQGRACRYWELVN
jgi:hypothetical protein